VVVAVVAADKVRAPALEQAHPLMAEPQTAVVVELEVAEAEAVLTPLANRLHVSPMAPLTWDAFPASPQESGRFPTSPIWARLTLWSGRNRLLLPEVPAVAEVVQAAVVAAVVELPAVVVAVAVLLPAALQQAVAQQVVAQRLEPAHPQLRAQALQQVAAVVAAAATPIPIRFRSCADLQPSHGFRSCRGPQLSMTTIKPMR